MINLHGFGLKNKNKLGDKVHQNRNIEEKAIRLDLDIKSKKLKY